ncbi:NAD-dependent epimerase/dehydratase family protein [Flagellimonas sp. DF-77]|uniref:NAD-dependent epimerase/dehydratase family protein n=1 Tax=Flagellimonas algarum TaxID=3230298 RepID=UPI003394B23B
MKILVTGAAGFIGFHTVKVLLDKGHHVVALDNINGYYDSKLKYARLEQLGIRQTDASQYHILCYGDLYGEALSFVRMAIEDREKVPRLFRKQKFDIVCNLAAQAGVRYSIENPEVYVDSNVVGFLNILECCKNFDIKHLVYASSSSVYGASGEIPFHTDQKTDAPVSLYAATKKSNELLAHTYSHLFGIAVTGLRFFTVYGPWGRPDMAYFLFTDAIEKSKAIKVFNHGNLERDFTYIDDIVNGVVSVIEKGSMGDPSVKGGQSRIYNIGNNTPVPLKEFIATIEGALGKEAVKEYLPHQPGDVPRTWADIDSMGKDYGYRPTTSLSTGIENFVRWYKSYFNND